MKTFPELDDAFQYCRWPIGDGPFLFCGDPVQCQSSYCSHHHEIAWTPVASKPAKARVYHGTDFSVRA